MSTLNAFRQKALEQQGRVAGPNIGARRKLNKQKQKAQQLNNIPPAQPRTTDNFSANTRPVSNKHRQGNAYQGTGIRYTKNATAPVGRHQKVQNVHDGTEMLMRKLPHAQVTDDQRLAFLDTIISTPALHNANSLRRSANRFAKKPARKPGAPAPQPAAQTPGTAPSRRA